MSFSPSDGISFWLKIAVIVAVILLAANFFRVNREEPSQADRPPRVEYSSGDVARGQFTIPEDGELSFRILLNRRALLKGDFKSLTRQQPIECLILDKENYDKRKAGGKWEAALRTGHIPGGKLNRELQPGDYRLVITSRDETKEPVDVSLEVFLD